MGVEAVFLDLGGVIFDIAWEAPFKTLGIQDRSKQEELVNQIRAWETLHQFERGQVTDEEFIYSLGRFIFPLTDEKFGADQLKTAWKNLILGVLPEADQIISKLKGKVPFYALTNTNVIHRQHLQETFPIMKEFDEVFASYEMGSRKPEKGIYEMALNKMKLNSSQTLFIDDQPENIEMANRLGMKAFQTVNDPKTTIEILQRELS